MTRLRLDLHEKNRLTWNAATKEHNARKADQAKFLREGGTTLFPEEIELVGALEGKRVLHPLCNSGQDTLSLARHAAETVGVDISDEAIAFAQQLSQDAGITATFVRSEIFAWLDGAIAEGRQFDLVFMSYGAVGWISDVPGFIARLVELMAPGARLAIQEFHPVAWMFEDGELRYDYFDTTPIEDVGVHDYVGGSAGALSPSGHVDADGTFTNPHPDYSFQFSVGEIVSACLDAGLTVKAFREYPYANGAKIHPALELREGRRWYFPAGTPGFPLMFGFAADRC